MRNRLSFRVAFCGVLAALMIAVMLLGTMIPTTTYICPGSGRGPSAPGCLGIWLSHRQLCSTWPWLC